MTEKDMIEILIEQGWICEKDEVGDCFCVAEVGGVEVQITPSVKKRLAHFRVSLMPSVSTKKFSEAVAFVRGEENRYSPIIVSNEPPEKPVKLSSSDVAVMSKRVISWACSQDIESGVSFYKQLPTDSKGILPLKHLAALAISGDFETLNSYSKIFEAGDRLGFVPYITEGMIHRAVLKATSET
ncbi:DUF6990 domain-containing protein [Pseudomonas cremoricolorata]|uniref:DUF6990 domain-containing protein n=1 Tax=Pseudomonas cremoricolorata TaxID=157783 RepID=UPI0009DBCED2|nr:hypothetical protein [Pseudomonas cremoricolorata]